MLRIKHEPVSLAENMPNDAPTQQPNTSAVSESAPPESGKAIVAKSPYEYGFLVKPTEDPFRGENDLID